MALDEMQPQPQAVSEPSTKVDQMGRVIDAALNGRDARLRASEEIQFVVSQSKKAGNGLFKEKKYKGESSRPLVNARLAG